jgi:glycosyltransferase involved in cell wall biosynthesis
MKQFTDLGGHLYFVSEHQHIIYNELSARILGHPVENVKGYINPAFSEGNEIVSKDTDYDVATIGRTSYMKDPFWIHRQLENTSYSSAVITIGGYHLKSLKEKKYYEDNLKWNEIENRTTFRDLSHADGLYKMSRSKIFVSTWPLETWGITTLEALCHGLPTILLTDKTGKHASEIIAADQSHIRLLPKNVDQRILEEIIKELMNFSYEKRLEISTMTKLKHSRDNFTKQFDMMFQLAINDRSSSKASSRNNIMNDIMEYD